MLPLVSHVANLFNLCSFPDSPSLYVIHLFPIGPAVWPHFPGFWIVDPPKTRQVPPCVSRGNLFGVYPFSYGSADVCQIWGQSVQPFDSFTRFLNLWHPNPPPPNDMPPGVLRGDLYLAYVHSQMNPKTWTKVGANRSSCLVAFP